MNTMNFKWLLRVIQSAAERFYWDNGFSKAASLAYTSLLSLVPVTFIGFGFLASFAVSIQDRQKLREFIFHHFVPNQQTVSVILERLTEIDQTLNSSSLSFVAVVFFAITALLLINSIEFTLNEIWQVFEPRTISQRLSIFCAILVITPILLVSTYYTTKLRLEPFFISIEALAPFHAFYNHLISISIDLTAFFILFFLIPKAPVKVSAAIFGAAVTALLFDVAKFYFTAYVVHFSSYDKLYGAVAVIPIFLFWLYLTWTIILFGCEVCYQYQYLPTTGKIWKKQVTSVGDGALLLATQTLVLVGRAFQKGERAPNELQLSEQLGCSSIVLKPIVDALKRANILLQGDSRDMPLVFARDPKTISATEVHISLAPDGQSVQVADSLSTLFAHFGEKLPHSLYLDKLLLSTDVNP